MTTKKSKADDKAQSKAFIEKAREIGADEDRSRADGLLSRLARMPRETQSAIRKKKTDKRPGG